MNQHGMIKYIKRALLNGVIISIATLLLPNIYAQTNTQTTQTVKQAAILNEAGVKYLYNTWVKALQEQDIEMWQKLTPTHQQRKIRNELVSKRRQFPTDVFLNGVSSFISLHNLSMVSLTQNGVSAKAVFFGDLQLIEDMPNEIKYSNKPTILARQSLYSIDFYAQAGWWKIAQAGIFDLRHQPELKTQLLQYQFEPIQLPIPKQLPELEPLVSPADYIGNVWIKAQGAQVDIEVNGVTLPPVIDAEAARLILGGLKLGPNTIRYRIKTSQSIADAGVIAAIEVFALSEKRGNKPVNIWSLQKQKSIVTPDQNGFYTSSFELTWEVAKELNI